MAKTIDELSDIELWEDLCYWLQQAQYRSPTFTDEIYEVITKILREMGRRLL